MTFFRTLFIYSFFIFIAAGCSTKVEDKNSKGSQTEIEDLADGSEGDTDKNTNQENDESETVKSNTPKVNPEGKSIEVDSFLIQSLNETREDSSADSNLLSKYYSLKACFSDRNIVKGLGQRVVRVDGKMLKTDLNGCVYFEHDIKIDYNESNSCKVFEKEVRFSKNKMKRVKYSIDYLTNQVTDLAISRGCVSTISKTKGTKRSSSIELGNVGLRYGNLLTKVRSDKRNINHETIIESCIKVSKTGKNLRNTNIKLTATNSETGQISNGMGFLKTNSIGCFSTSIQSIYEQFRNSHWMDIDLRIDVLSGPLKGKGTNKVVYINPWEEFRTQYGRGNGSKPTQIPFKNKYSKVHMDGVMYIQIGNNTKEMSVSDYLGLTISKKYQVVLNPYIDREHRYTKGKAPIERSIYKGKFKLSLLLLAPKNGAMEINKNNFEDFEYVTGAETVVEANNGIINAMINIPFNMVDLPRLAVRTMSIFKVEPLGDTGLRSTLVTGFFKARIAWIKTNVLQDDGLNTNSFIDKQWKSHFKDQKTKSFTREEINETCSNSSKSDNAEAGNHNAENGTNEVEFADCIGGLNEILASGYDQKTFDYKKFIGQMFQKLEVQKRKAKSRSRQEITAKSIYVNQLKKHYEDITILDTESAASEKYKMNFKTEDFDTILPQNGSVETMTENMIEEICRYAITKDDAYEPGFLWGYRKKSWQHCLDKPAKFFGIKPVRHINKVNSIGDSYANGFAIYTGERYGVSKSEKDSISTSTTYSVSADIGIKLPLPKSVSDILGIGAKVGVSKSRSESHSVGSGYAVAENIGTSKNLGVEKFVVDLNISSQRCFLVVSKDHLDLKLSMQRHANAPRGPYGDIGIDTLDEANHDYYFPKTNLNVNLYICDKNDKNENFTESWFFIQSRIDSAVARDYDGVNERKLLKVIRGDKSYREFRTALRSISEQSLALDNIGYGTPEAQLVEAWGHLLGDKLSDEDAAKFLLRNVEGSFPGTIEGNGSTTGVQ